MVRLGEYEVLLATGTTDVADEWPQGLGITAREVFADKKPGW
jgi:hypothetical protein